MEYEIREMRIDDHGQVHNLWEQIEYLNVDESDRLSAFARYITRNPGLCFVADNGSEIIGTVMCGQEGRRGFLRHLAVRNDCRGQEIARQLIEHTLRGLAAQGIERCNAFVENANEQGFEFWERMGWRRLPDDFKMIQLRELGKSI